MPHNDYVRLMVTDAGEWDWWPDMSVVTLYPPGRAVETVTLYLRTEENTWDGALDAIARHLLDLPR